MKKKRILMLIAAMAVLALFLASLLLYKRIEEYNLQQYLATTTAFEMPTEATAPTLPVDPDDPNPTAPTKAPANVAPNFSLLDAAGNTVTLESLKGKPIVLAFWSVRNGDSMACLSYLDQLYKTRGDQYNVLVIHVCDGVEETQGDGITYLTERGITAPACFDDGTVAAKYQATKLPMTIFLNKDMVPKAYSDGAMSQSDLEQGLKAAK